MALLLVKEDGSGKADANSYASVADADVYHEGHLYAADWTAAIAATKAAALVMATRLIDSFFQFRGLKGRAVQALQWPRVSVIDVDSGEALDGVVPAMVVSATAEAARALIKADRTADPEGEGLAVETDFTTRSVTYNAQDRRPILPLVVQVMLSKYGNYSEEPTRPSRGGVVPLRRV